MPSPSPAVQRGPLDERRVARTLPGLEPRLVVVVDTEEEFDWSAPFDRGATSVEALRDLGPFQALCEAHGLRPTYVIDHPVASQETGRRALAPLVREGRALVGAHLHPWVSPPHEEQVCARNSYPGNLPPALEEAKLARLCDEIERGIGERPRVYKAGRYGLGANTPAILARLGFEIDLSAASAFDLGADGGPDWSRVPADPFWFGPGERLLELPTTGAFVGWLSRFGATLHRAATTRPLRHARLGGILARSGALERLMLSPEGYRPRHLRRLTRALLARGTRVFSFSLHSPSLRPGCTPYVRSAGDLQEFLESCRQYFSWFLGELGGRPATPLEVRALCADPHSPSTGHAA